MAVIRGGISQYLANKLLNYALNGVDPALPATLYLAINKSVWSPGANAFTEPSGGSYARVALSRAVGLFGVPVNGGTQSATLFTFPTAGADWCPTTALAYGWFIADAATAGNALIGADRTGGPRTILAGDVVSMAIGALSVQMS